MISREYADFYDRASAMGYTIDRDYYEKNRNHKKIAVGCILIIIFGFTVRAFGALHKQREWDRMTKEANELRKQEVSRERKFASKDEYLAYLIAHDEQRRALKRKYQERLKPETSEA